MPLSTKRLVALTLLPIVVLDGLLAPFWFIPGYVTRHDWIPLSQWLISGLFFPFYLGVFGSVCILKGRLRSIVSTLGVLAAASWLGMYLTYITWRAANRLSWQFDIKTIEMSGFLSIYALLIAVVPVSIVFLVRRRCSSFVTAPA